MKKRFWIPLAALVLALTVTLAALPAALRTAKAADPAQETTWDVVRADDFERLDATLDTAAYDEQYIWDNTQTLWIKGPYARPTTDDPISGEKSLLWDISDSSESVPGWADDDHHMGVSDGKVTGVDNTRLRFSAKVRLSGVQTFGLRVTGGAGDKVLLWMSDAYEKTEPAGWETPWDGAKVTVEKQGTYAVITADFTYGGTKPYIYFCAYVKSAQANVVFDDIKVERPHVEIVQKTDPTAYEVVKADDFEGLDASQDAATYDNQFIWDNTAMMYSEGNCARPTSDDPISGSTSLLWSPGLDWTDSQHRLGITDKKISGLEGGYMIRISLKVRLSDTVDFFGIKSERVSGGLLQEMQMNGSYERVTGGDSGVRDTGEETYVTIEKHETYADVSLAYRGGPETPYFYFAAHTTDAAATILLDDVTVERERAPVIDYRNYHDGWEERFESGTADNALAESKFVGGAAGAEYSLETEKPLSGAQSLAVKVSGINRFGVDNVILTANDLALAAGWHKLYYRFRPTEVGKFSIVFTRHGTDTVVYDQIYNLASGERVPGVTSVIADASGFDWDATGVYRAYGEFETEADATYDVAISINPGRGNRFVLDDFAVLDAYTPPAFSGTVQNPPRVSGEWQAKAGDVAISPTPTVISAGPSVLEAVAAVDPIEWSMVALYGTLAIAGVVAAIVGRVRGKRTLTLGFAVLLAACLLTAPLTGCVKHEPVAPVETIAAGYTAVTPERIDGKLDNPGMGWVVLEEPTYGGHVDLGASGTLPEVDNVSLDTSWAHIEIAEDVYDFTYVDQTVDYWASQGKHINFRICTDTLMLTYTYKGVPDYLFEKYNIGYRGGLSYTDPSPVTEYLVADVTDPIYLERLGIFLEKLAEHYADNPAIDVVEIRGYGVWGEWHSGYPYRDKDERMTALRGVIDKYYDAYAAHGKLLCVGAAWDPLYTSTGEYGLESDDAYGDYVKWSAFDYAWRMPGVTFRRDSGGALLRYDLDERILAEAFRSGKRVPILGEYATNFDNLKNSSGGFDLMDGINDILFKMRANYSTVLGWVNVEIANTLEQGYTDYVDYANTMFGYRLTTDRVVYPEAVDTGKPFTVLSTWANSACGIFWYKAPLTYYLLDESGDPVWSYTDREFDARTFVQGETTDFYSTLTLPDTVANGTYRLAVAITDTDGAPWIELGQAGEIGDTRMYEIGDIEVKDNVTLEAPAAETDYASLSSFRFAPDTTYRLTFKYLPGFDMQNFYFDQNDGYVFSLTSATNHDEIGVYKWQDISGEAGWRTVEFTTGNASDYKAAIRSENFGEITVGDVWIRTLRAKTERFENYDFLEMGTVLEMVARDSADTVADSALDGGAVRLQTRSNKGDNALAKVDIGTYKFEVGKTYSVTFDFANESDIARGGYFFVATSDYDNVNRMQTKQPMNIIGRWYERQDNYATKKTFMFPVTEENTTLVFGVRNGGSYDIDNLIIAEYDVDAIVGGTDKGFERNVIPMFEHGVGIVEDFEGASFASSGFEWGQFAWGRMTIDPAEVVNYDAENNKCSLLGRVEPVAQNPEIDNVWFEFARTKPKYYTFEPNATYRVQFDYKILKSYPQGKIFCFFRGGDSVADDDGFSAGKTVGEVYKYDKTFALHNFSNYQFIICCNYIWEVSIDNILITKVD